MASIYRRLTISPPHIRLLNIRPGPPSSDLVCKLHEVELTSNPNGLPAYEALSYTWRTEFPKKTITINDTRVEIGSNLHSALLQFRQQDRNRLIWADAVCINQADNVEKASQVELMRPIYQRAERTLVWLGEEDETSATAIGMLTALSGGQEAADRWAGLSGEEQRPDRGDPGPFFYDDDNFAPNMDEIMYEVVGKALSTLPDIDDEKAAIEAVRNLLNRPWFNRLWVVQEIANSRRIQMCCGPHSFDWNAWSLVQQAVKYIDHSICMEIGQLVSTGKVSRLVTERQRTKSYWRSLGFVVATPLLAVLGLYRRWESTDARDKVFATKNLMSNDADMPLPLADYNASVRSVYCYVAHASIRYHHDLTVLCMPHAGNGGGEHDLPSWIPDWSRAAGSSYDLFRSYSNVSETKGAAGGVHPQGPSIQLEPGTTCKVCDAPYDLARFRESMDFDLRFNSEDSINDDGLVRRPVKLGSWEEPGLDVLHVDGVECGKIVLHRTVLESSDVPLPVLRDVLQEWYAESKKQPPQEHAKVLDDSEEQAALSFFLLLTSNKTVFTMTGPVEVHRSIANLLQSWLEAGDEALLHSSNAFPMAEEIASSIRGYTFAWLKRDGARLPAMVPNTAQTGDPVAVILGCRLPLVLRAKAVESREYEVIGGMHCPGIMEGEVLGELEAGKCVSSTFSLV